MQMSEKYFMQISRKSQLSCYCFFEFFWWQKIVFKSSLDLYFHPSITEFRVEEKIHTKVVVNVSRDARGRIFLGKIREGVSGNLLSRVKLCQRIWKSWLFALCYFKSLQDKRYAVFSFEMFNIKILKILKKFKYNMKFMLIPVELTQK